MQAHEVSALVVAHDAEGNHLLALLISRHLVALSHAAIGVQIGLNASLGHYDGHGASVVGIIGLHSHVVNLRAYAEGRVRR